MVRKGRRLLVNDVHEQIRADCGDILSTSFECGAQRQRVLPVVPTAREMLSMKTGSPSVKWLSV